MASRSRPTAIDLFCGVGGMSLGFEQAGFDVVAAFDDENRHVIAYQANHPHTKAFTVDLSGFSGRELRKLAGLGNRAIDVLFGGPPCQGFSVGGRRDLDDPRNQLLHEFARLVRELHPRYFVVENVEGLLYGHSAAVVKSFCRRIRLSGYDVVEPIKVVDAAEFGVPQRRKRTFILGFRNTLPPPAYPDPSGLRDTRGNEYFPTVRDAIGDLPDVDLYDELLDCDGMIVDLPNGSHYARLMRGDAQDPSDHSHVRRTPRLLTGCLRTRHSKDTVRRFKRTTPGTLEPVSRYFRLSLDDIANTIRAGTGVGYGRHTAPRPIHPERPRCITVREAARLHSFPDWYQFHPTRWHAFRQIGNSVPPLLARRLAHAVLVTLTSSSSRAQRARTNGN